MAFIQNAEGNFFIQQQRNTPFAWLTCTGVGDTELPTQERTPVECQDPLNSGQFKIDGYVRGSPGTGTYTLTKPLASVHNFLIEEDCTFIGRINWVCRGIRGDPTNYELAVLLLNSESNRKRITSPVAMEGGESGRVNTNADIGFQQYQMLYRTRMTRIQLLNDADAYSIFFLPERCEDRCGSARGVCEYGIMGLDDLGGYIYASEIKKTFDGVSWVQTTSSPYDWGGYTRDVLILETLDGNIYVVFRGEQLAPAPAECGISYDEGVTWNNVTIGTALNEAINAHARSGAKIVVVGTGGYIYTSIDSAQSWTQVGAGATVENLNDVAFYQSDENKGYAVGNNNTFLTTDDAAITWIAGTGPAVGVNLLSVAVNDRGHVFVTTNDARIFVSEDEGVTWTERLNLNNGSIDWIKFDEQHRYIGWMIHNDTTPVGWVYRSEDGGATWQRVGGQAAGWNSGLNSGHVCDANNVYVVGNIHNGTTFAAKSTSYISA